MKSPTSSPKTMFIGICLHLHKIIINFKFESSSFGVSSHGGGDSETVQQFSMTRRKGIWEEGRLAEETEVRGRQRTEGRGEDLV